MRCAAPQQSLPKTPCPPPCSPCSTGAGAVAAQQQQQQSAVSFPYAGSLCLHATERRQQEFEFDSVFSGESSQVGCVGKKQRSAARWVVLFDGSWCWVVNKNGRVQPGGLCKN